MHNYYELTVNVYLLKNVHKNDALECISNFINYSFNGSNLLCNLHTRKGYKHYSFNSLYPIEKDGVYKMNEIYYFKIRSYNKEVIAAMSSQFKNLKNDNFVVTLVENKELSQNYTINYVNSITPAIICTKGKLYWSNKKHTEDEAFESLFNNLVSKYNNLNGINMNINYNDVISKIQITSNVGIITNYKNTKFLGFKYRVYFKYNTIAQELAKLAEVEGIGCKNSAFGAGFVEAKYQK